MKTLILVALTSTLLSGVSLSGYSTPKQLTIIHSTNIAFETLDVNYIHVEASKAMETSQRKKITQEVKQNSRTTNQNVKTKRSDQETTSDEKPLCIKKWMTNDQLWIH